MTEAWEDDEPEDDELEDFDASLRDEIAALREQVEEETEVARINRSLSGFQRQYGLSLSAADVQSMGELIDAGHDPESAYTELQGADFEDQFLAAVEKVERKQGRSLLDAEVQKLWEASVRESDPEHIDQAAILDLDKPADRAQLIDERLSPTPDPEPVAPLAADATDAERQTYTEARMNGAEVEPAEETE